MSVANTRRSTILPLYIPVLLSFLLIYAPILSYLVAWGGSIFIFYQTWFSKSIYIKKDLRRSQQLMRPIFLIQLIFAGFMACTSIFFFLDHLGYRYLSKLNIGDAFLERETTYLIAKCQRLCLLAHAALVTGMIYNIDREEIPQKYFFDETNNKLMKFTIGVYLMGLITDQIPGLTQISLPLSNIGLSCAVILFLKGILQKNSIYTLIGGSVFLINFINASLSGYKEPIIINFILLVVILFPYFKKTITFISIPTLYILFYFLPTYNAIIRSSWTGEITAESAQTQAFETLIGNQQEDEIAETNWGFLTNRLSEINMFVQFVEYVPEKRDYYGWEIFNNSMKALIPRVIWPEKPSIEEISMDRVYDAGVVNRLSTVSAKTRPVVDAYLSWGILGVFCTMFILGSVIQWICNKAELWFGGYQFGCVIIFNSLFQNLWRGNNFEFMINNIVYAFLIMFAIWLLLKKTLLVKPI